MKIEERCEIALDFCKKVLLDLFMNKTNTNQLVDVPNEFKNIFPHEKIYNWQLSALKLIDSDDDLAILAPTGAGKTAVFIAIAYDSLLREKKVVLVEPRNDLQQQILERYGNFLQKKGFEVTTLFAREKYPCELEYSCKAKYRRGPTWYFRYKDKEYRYPCDNCVYDTALSKAREVFLKSTGLVILNHGNLFLLNPLKSSKREYYPDLAIIDECDSVAEFFMSKIKIDKELFEDAFNYAKDVLEREYDDEDIEKVLELYKKKLQDYVSMVDNFLEISEATSLFNEIKKRGSAKIFNKKLKKENIDSLEDLLIILNSIREKLEHLMRKVKIFELFSSNCFMYEVHNIVYVKMFDENILDVFKKVFFKAARKVVVSATLPDTSSWLKVEGYVEFPNAKVIFVPVENLSVTNLQNIGFEKIDIIVEKLLIPLCKYFETLNGKTKVVIHSGNIKKHGKRIYEVLVDNGYSVLLHEEGKLKEIVEKFKNESFDFLVAAAIERGIDLAEKIYALQFVFKVPYRDLGDPEVKGIRKRLKEKFNDWYEMDAGIRMIQAAGRNARDPNSPAVSIIPDTRALFTLNFLREKGMVPDWFEKRLVICREVLEK